MHLSTNLGPEGVGMLRLNRVVPLRYKWKKVRGKKRLCSNHWFTGTVDKLVPRACVTRCAWLRRPIMKQLVADPGEGSGEPGPSPLIFRANWGPKDRKSFVWRPPPPPYLRVWMTPPPYLKVWIRHCEKSFTFTFTTLCVHHAFLYISLPSLHYSSRRENAYQRFVEDVSAGPRLSLSFPELWYSLFEWNPRKNCQHLTNWKRWAKGDKVWSSAASLFEWRFRSRRRSCCLSSQLINHLHVGVSAKTVASE